MRVLQLFVRSAGNERVKVDIEHVGARVYRLRRLGIHRVARRARRRRVGGGGRRLEYLIRVYRGAVGRVDGIVSGRDAEKGILRVEPEGGQKPEALNSL